MKKFPKHFLFAVLIILSMVFFFVAHYVLSKNITQTPLWQYQCIDTMKISRDQARSWQNKPNFDKEIDKEMAIIKELGANCVAVGTPYDEEFIPYLTMWVQAARKQHLHVWFRGNFSSWEGWFSYPKGMTPQDHIEKTQKFILNHRDLFADGDIFTPAPEAENGWNNGSIPQSDYELFRQFMINEHQNTQDTFNEIGKHVQTNWLSMNGNVAMSVLDQPTIDALGGIVTIDHYVKDSEDMKKYIDYFSQNFHARVVIGEFGAPIPDINGEMTQQEQADFVDSIFNTLYEEHDAVYAVSYWVLKDGTTALLDDNDNAKLVTNVIQKYYIPHTISGRITDELGDPISDATVLLDNGEAKMQTNTFGQYRVITPKENISVTIAKENYATQTKQLMLSSKISQENIILIPNNPSFIYEFRLKIEQLFNSFSKKN